MSVMGYAPGAYDMFHIGHLRLLQRASRHCDELVVGVVTDEVLARAKGKLPVVPLAERLGIVASMRCVDRVVVDDCVDKFDMWPRLHYDVLFKGDDWQGTAKGERLERNLATVGATLVYFPYTAHTSSTRLRALLTAAADHGRVPAAAAG